MKGGKHHGSSTSIKSGNSKISNRERPFIPLTSSIYSQDIRSSRKIEKLPYGNRSPSSPPERPKPNFLLRDDKYGVQSSSANSCTNCKDVFKKIKSKSTKLSRTPSETNPLTASKQPTHPKPLGTPKSLASSKLSKVVAPPPISIPDDKEVDSLGIHLSTKFMKYDSPRYNKKHIHDDINPTTLILPSTDNVNVNVNDLSLDLSKLDSLSVSSRTVFKSAAFSPINSYQDNDGENEINSEGNNNNDALDYNNNNINNNNNNNSNRINQNNNTISNNSENLNYNNTYRNNNSINMTPHEYHYINYHDININRSEIISSDSNSDQNLNKKKETRRVSFSDNLVQTIYIESIDWDDTSHLYDKVKSTEELIERVRNVREQRRAKSKVLFKFVDNIMNIQNSIGQLNMDPDRYRHKSRTLKKK